MALATYDLRLNGANGVTQFLAQKAFGPAVLSAYLAQSTAQLAMKPDHQTFQVGHRSGLQLFRDSGGRD
jgi:hypothetical protein